MFERFTERARKVVVLAQEEARHFNHNYIGTEHLLLGLVREEDGVASKALRSVNVSLDRVREQVEKHRRLRRRSQQAARRRSPHALKRCWSFP